MAALAVKRHHKAFANDIDFSLLMSHGCGCFIISSFGIVNRHKKIFRIKFSSVIFITDNDFIF